MMPALLVAAALFLYLTRLSVPPRYVYDERYHAFTAAERLRGNSDSFRWDRKPARPDAGYTWNHPPLGVQLISTGIALWGDRAVGWRFASAIFGAAGILLTYLLARALSGERAAGEVAAGLLLLDGLYFVQARTAMLDLFGAVFMLGALLAFYRFLTAPPARTVVPVVLTGVCLGLAIANKWSAAYPALLIGLAAVARAVGYWRRYSATGDFAMRSAATAHAVWIPVALGLVPAGVYLAAYLPFFAAGNDVVDFAELQRRILAYHTGLRVEHAYASRWWEWGLALRPVWYHVAYGRGVVSNIYAQVNPLLVWAFLPAVVWVSLRWWSVRRAALVVLAIGFWGQWLPWAAVPRITYVYHFLPVVPFGAVAVAAVISSWWRASGSRPWLAAGYVTAVAATFVYFHPIYAAVPLSRPAFEQRLWLERWR
jgi:dolichyl-phosphate-mannose--protein O-mannosyl transferase